MIDKETVFVLGAGASQPYGFPGGKRLVRKILADLERPEILAAVADAAECETVDVTKFARALNFSGTKSVDLFLEGRDDLIEVGKVAIAAALIPCENEGGLFADRGRGWYDTLLDRMGGTADDFGKNRLRVLTFNYDRSLEQFLVTALRNRFHIGKPQVVQLLGGDADTPPPRATRNLVG